MKNDLMNQLLTPLSLEEAATINGGRRGRGADDGPGDDRGGRRGGRGGRRGRGSDDPVGHT